MEHYISSEQVTFMMHSGSVLLAFIGWVFLTLAARSQKWPIWKYPILVILVVLMYMIFTGIADLYFTQQL